MKRVLAGLSRSDRLFLVAYAGARTVTEAGRRWAELRGVRYTNLGSASSKASRKLHEIRRKIEESGDPELFWELLELGANKIAKALSEGMDATMVKPMLVRQAKIVQAVSDKGEMYDKVVGEDVLIEAGPYPDHLTRINAAMSAARLRGDIKRAEIPPRK